MSFAGKVTRGRLFGRQRYTPAGPPGRPPQPSAKAVPTPDSEVDWQQVAIFATGVAVGILAGAGVALLVAPQTGRDTRRAIARRGRKLRARTHDAWDDLRDELRQAARRSGRSLRGMMRRRARRYDEYEREMPYER